MILCAKFYFSAQMATMAIGNANPAPSPGLRKPCSYVQQDQTKPVVSKLSNTQGELTSSDQETANTLNDHFASAFAKENEQNIPPFQI